jgi:crotonobetainyl-CoA:carnitine CoA-transferase CaiB-like acyl-CoA transferase
MASLRTPVRIAGAEPSPRPAPRLGADGEQVLAEAGFSGGEIDELRRLGALG